jgi:hypothetical protein
MVPGDNNFIRAVIYKCRAYPKPTQAKPLAGVLGVSRGRLLALPTNIRLGWKGLQETNSLAYSKNSQFTVVKIFLTLTPEL